MAIMIHNQVTFTFYNYLGAEFYNYPGAGRDEVRAGWLESYSDLLSEWVKPVQVSQNLLF